MCCLLMPLSVTTTKILLLVKFQLPSTFTWEYTAEAFLQVWCRGAPASWFSNHVFLKLSKMLRCLVNHTVISPWQLKAGRMVTAMLLSFSCNVLWCETAGSGLECCLVFGCGQSLMLSVILSSTMELFSPQSPHMAVTITHTSQPCLC